MKATVNIEYATLGGFTLNRELTAAQVDSAKKIGKVRLNLMRLESEHSCMVVQHPDDEAFIRLQKISFCGSSALPEPGLFRSHMAEFRSHGWELADHSQRGLFAMSPRYRRALNAPIPVKEALAIKCQSLIRRITN